MREWLLKRSVGVVLGMLVLVPHAEGAGEETYLADEIVVTSTRTERSSEESAGSVIVVSRKEIEAAATPDLKAILRQVPGLLVNDSGVPAGVATASIRGSRSTQVLILLDGVRLSNAQTSLSNLNDLPVPLELVERMEIIPLPASSLYGADALGGVINIITRPAEKKTMVSLSQGVGSFSDLRTAAAVQAGAGPLALRAAAQLRSSDGYRDNSDYDLENVSVDIGTKISALQLDFGADFIKREGGSPGIVEFPTPEARQEDEKSYFNLSGSYRPGGRWVLGGTLFFDSQLRDYLDPAFGEDSRHKNRKGGIDLQGNLEGGAWGLWTVGGEWIRDDVDSTNAGEHDSTRWAAYLQDEWDRGPWTVVGTVRIDDHSVYGSEVNPRLLIMRKLVRQWRLWASGSRGYRAPNFDDLFWTGVFGQGNPDLEPETSWDFEFGGEKRWGGKGRLRLVAFHRDVDNLIQWTDPDGDFVYSPENVASARIRGVEADVEYAPLPWLIIPLGYQYLDPEDRDTGEKLEGQVRHLLQAAVRLQGRGFLGGLEGYYADRYDTSRSEDWSYTVVAATLGWQGKVARLPLKASLRLDNIFDEDYETVEGFPMPGRHLYGEVGLTF